jgi:diguanylate cyclase (GGDEF)-like protein
MPVDGSQSVSRTEAARFSPGPPARSSSRRVLPIDRWNKRSDTNLEDALSTALVASDDELGRLLHEVEEISNTLKTKTPDEQAVRLAAHPAVWTAVRQALLDRELRHLALTDDLTCLYNRRGFFAAATHQLEIARRNSQSLMLFFCDVDNLKTINDRYGHQEGDFAIIRTADALEQTFRRSDVLARFGGDEFVVLSVETSHQHQNAILGRLEKNVKKFAACEPRYQLSVSVGAARFDPNKPLSLGELVAKADEAMYERKRGRSRTQSGKS